MNSDELSFDRPRVWEFLGREYYDVTKPPAPTAPKKLVSNKFVSYAIVSASFDKAFQALRARHPRMRVEQVRVINTPVSYVADDPRTLELVERLSE